MIRAILCDIDGVLLRDTGERFSTRYAQEHSFDASKLGGFFQTVFPLALTGKADLRDILWEYRVQWHITSLSERDALFTQWVTDHGELATENIAALQQQAVPVYAATNQEVHRGRYISEEIMPRGLFTKKYVSANIGHAKPSIDFFNYVYNDLCLDEVIASPNEILFIDDDTKNIAGGKQAGLTSIYYDGSQGMGAILTDNS